MSALVMGLVWELPESAEFSRPEKLVLLAYADHADSNGKSIYPSVDLICKKTFYEERSVQKITRILEKLGLLVADGVGPHGTNRWSIPIVRTSDGGAKIAGVQNAGAENAPEGNAPEGNAPEGNAPEPSLVVKESLVFVIGGDIFKMYEQEFGGLTPIIADAIRDAEQTYPPEWIPEAMEIAVKKNIRTWDYVEGILKNCKAKNVRPSLNKLEARNANTRAGNKPGTKPKQQESSPAVEQDAAKLAEINRRRRERQSKQPVSV